MPAAGGDPKAVDAICEDDGRIRGCETVVVVVVGGVGVVVGCISIIIMGCSLPREHPLCPPLFVGNLGRSEGHARLSRVSFVFSSAQTQRQDFPAFTCGTMLAQIIGVQQRVRDVESVAEGEAIDATTFHVEFLRKSVPLIIRGGAKKLRSFERWTDAYLLKHLAGTRVSIHVPGGSGGSGDETTTTFERLWEWFSRSDSSPPSTLALSDFRLRDGSPILVRDASPFPLPCTDLLSELPRHMDPGYLWLFAGHRGSGSRMHRDVLGTHAWVAQLRGRKVVRIFARNAFEPGEHRTVDAFAPAASQPRRLPLCREARLDPGDLLFVPAMAWHQDRNESGSFGVTGNFCEPTILSRTVEIARALNENELGDALALFSRSSVPPLGSRRERHLMKVASASVDEAHLQ
jgi:hypothetical protein